MLDQRESIQVIEPTTLTQRQPVPPAPTGTITAEAVPEAQRKQPVPLVRIIMPIVMVAAMLGMVAFMVLSGGSDRTFSPLMLMFPIMMLASMFMMFSPTTGGQDPDETRRTYLRHLKALREKALDNGAAQRAHELHRHPPVEQLPAFVHNQRLWERSAGDPDALEVRIGVGETKLATEIQVPEAAAAEDLDPVCAVSLRRTIQAVETLPEMPVVIQLACAHGPDTLGISVRSVRGAGWEWVKWLPHARRPEQANYRVLIVDGVATTGVEDFLDEEGVTTIIDVGSRRNTALGLRAEHEGLCLSLRDEAGGDAGTTLLVSTAAGEEELGRADQLAEEGAVLIARRMARCRRPLAEPGPKLGSGGGDLVALLGHRDIAELRGENLWPGRAGSQRLHVPVGLDPSGQPVYLDLKESAQGGMGPHGLCIGATGSGKSELLRSLVTALAATHSPEELNLVLVDFKGGATFLGCEQLPHTAAVITNLEEESVLVERMYDAISGEMNRRQEILRQAGNFANVGDYNAGRDPDQFPPLPALVIVVDEFSELLGQHPDFADLFVAVGRLGRSLHVHLLLASQRLEEGRLRGLDSHLSYRIGLKTFSAAESRQVLGATDAYHLPARPGAGYLKTNGDALERFQATYVSGPLARPAEPAEGESVPPARVSVFDGWDAHTTEDSEPELVWDESTTLLNEVVAVARAEADHRGHSAHRIWLPPLPAAVELPEILHRAGQTTHLQAAVGLIDRPYHQRQDPLVVDFSTAGGHAAVCGGPQTGKSMALRTIVGSLAATHGTEAIRFYVIDLGGGALANLDRLPHVAGVAGRDEPDTVRRIIDEVTGLVERPEPRHTFLVLDGWHHVGTAGAEFNDLTEKITTLAADGPSARVHLVLSTPRWTTLRPSIRDLIAHRLELRLGEAMESLVDRKAQQKLPALPGRGLTETGEMMLLARTSNQDVAHLQSRGGEPVPRLKTLPAQLRPADLPRHALTAGLVWGIGGRDLEPVAWDPATSAHVVCVGASGSGKSTFVRVIADAVAGLPREDARLVVIDPRRAHLGALDEDMLAAYAATPAAAEKALRDTAATMRQRLPGPDITPARLRARDWWSGPEIYVVIDDAELTSEAALHPLVELIPHAQDIGLHVIFARKAGGIGRAMFGKFCSALKDTQPAVLLLDADKEEGPIFGMKPKRQPPGRGRYHLRGEELGLCQVIRADDQEDTPPAAEERDESHQAASNQAESKRKDTP